MLNVRLDGLPTGIPCLVDSGAAANRFSAEIAEQLDIKREDAPLERFSAGAQTYSGWFTSVQLSVEEWTWEAPVFFAYDWQPSYQLLGLEGFFRFFTVCFHTVDDYFELELAEH